MAFVLDNDLAGLFWDCDRKQLDPVARRDWIIERVLQRGTITATRWRRRSDGDAAIARFVRERGDRRRRDVQSFWRLFYEIPESACTRKSSAKPNAELWPF